MKALIGCDGASRCCGGTGACGRFAPVPPPPPPVAAPYTLPYLQGPPMRSCITTAIQLGPATGSWPTPRSRLTNGFGPSVKCSRVRSSVVRAPLRALPLRLELFAVRTTTLLCCLSVVTVIGAEGGLAVAAIGRRCRVRGLVDHRRVELGRPRSRRWPRTCCRSELDRGRDAGSHWRSLQIWQRVWRRDWRRWRRHGSKPSACAGTTTATASAVATK